MMKSLRNKKRKEKKNEEHPRKKIVMKITGKKSPEKYGKNVHEGKILMKNKRIKQRKYEVEHRRKILM